MHQTRSRESVASTQTSFAALVHAVEPDAARAGDVRSVMLNLGPRCTLKCTHCHIAASPERRETMSDTTLTAALRLVRAVRPDVVDITGGAPELHPRLRELVAELSATRSRARLRTNLVALLEPACEGLAEHLAHHHVELLASLPGLSAHATDGQRGDGTHEASLKALRMLNALGYGTRLRLDLAHNPDGPRLPDSGDCIDQRYRRTLSREGITFDELVVITNVPVGRFAEQLRASGSYDAYLALLRSAFNPETVPGLACRSSIEVGWDGTMWDCDFNVGAGAPALGGRPVEQVQADDLTDRPIAFGAHCFACTAETGSG